MRPISANIERSPGRIIRTRQISGNRAQSRKMANAPLTPYQNPKEVGKRARSRKIEIPPTQLRNRRHGMSPLRKHNTKSRSEIRRNVREQIPEAFGDNHVKISGTSAAIRPRKSGFLARRASPGIPSGAICGDTRNSRRNLRGVYLGSCGIVRGRGYFWVFWAQFKTEIDTPTPETITHQCDVGMRIGNIPRNVRINTGNGNKPSRYAAPYNSMW